MCIRDRSRGISYIEINDIKPNSNQPRKTFDEEKLDELASSIKEHGLIQPVVLRSVKNGYEIDVYKRQLLDLLYSVINNYGITIIVFTVIVKLCLYPLYIKQTKSTAKMSEVQPKMQALQRKYANDKETLNIKMAELYKEEKFNPMGGCLPMLIQMPIIMGLFALLRNPMMYMNDNSMIFAYHEPFIWIADLSQPDLWILPIIAGVATFISFLSLIHI